MKFYWPLAFYLLCLFAAPSNAQPVKDGLFLALKYDRETVSALVGDGTAWRILKQFPRSALAGPPALFRAGKMSLQADNKDHATSGESGQCHIEKISALGQTNRNYSPQFQSESVNALLSTAPLKLVPSPRLDTKIEWADGTLKISAAANSSALGEWMITPQILDEAIFSARITKNSDKGLSWGPGIALIWPGGQFILLNARHPLGEWSVTTREGETLIRN